MCLSKKIPTALITETFHVLVEYCPDGSMYNGTPCYDSSNNGNSNNGGSDMEYCSEDVFYPGEPCNPEQDNNSIVTFNGHFYREESISA